MPSAEPDVRFVVPGLPKSKLRQRSRIVRTKDGRQFVSNYTPAKTQNEEAVIRFAAQHAMDGRAPLEGPLDFRISIFLPVPRSWSGRKQREALNGGVRPAIKPDWDNAAKLSDACNGIVWRDDSQIVAAHVWKYYSDRPRVVCEVRLITPAVPAAAAKQDATLCLIKHVEN